jgi:quercetin dioxygenase-like cupin family protein
MSTQPFLATIDQGTALWHMGALLKFKAVGAETDGQFWLAEQYSERGYASPLHQHSREDELFIVLDGELTVHVDGTDQVAGEGAVAFAPRDLPHRFQVESPSARFLILSTPAGLEKWFFQTGTPALALTLPPPPDGPPDVRALVESLAAFGVRLLAPPPRPE